MHIHVFFNPTLPIGVTLFVSSILVHSQDVLGMLEPFPYSGANEAGRFNPYLVESFSFYFDRTILLCSHSSRFFSSCGCTSAASSMVSYSLCLSGTVHFCISFPHLFRPSCRLLVVGLPLTAVANLYDVALPSCCIAD